MSRRVQPTIGDELAGYQIEALAGRGGMGEVYRALDTGLGRNVALKVLVPQLADDERFRERFLRESRLAASLDHPNAIPVYEAGDADGRLYIAMRYVEGTDLRRVLADDAPLEPERALAVLASVAGALDAAHAKGLVHRDVKPGNILIAVEPDADPPEHVYLSDFGLTTLSADPDAGLFTGTADYAAPELVTGGSIDGRTDLYSLGCVLFECLTGEPPFRGDSVMSVLWGHVNDPVPAASERNRELPEAIDPVVRKVLAKEPAKRYGTCRELVEAARDALDVTGIEVPVVARRRWVIAAAVLAVALAAVAAALAALLTRGGGEAVAATGGALVRIDPATNSAGDPIRVGAGPETVAADDHDVWVSARRDAALWRFELATGTVSRVAAVGVPGDLALYGSRAYVAAEGPSAFTGNVTAYYAATGRRLGGVELLACSLTAGAEGVWVAGCPNIEQLSEGDPVKILRTLVVPFAAPRDTAHDRQELEDMTSGAGAVWALGDAADRRLWRIDPRSGRIARTYDLGFAPQHVEVGAGSIWVVDQFADAVVRIDLRSGRVVARIPVGRVASGLALGEGSVWTASVVDRTVERIDPRTNRVTATIRVDERPRDVAFGAGAVWVAGDAD
jgi:YVTN family beta-propeller protein